MPLPIRNSKESQKMWSPKHSFARMHRLLGPTAFVRRSLFLAVLISLLTICGRNALARVKQSARAPVVNWFVALPQVKVDDILACTVCRMPESPTLSKPKFLIPCLLSRTSRPFSGVSLFNAPSATRIHIAKVNIETTTCRRSACPPGS